MSDEKPLTFESLSRVGRQLLHETRDPASTHRDFACWDREVADWLDDNYPGTGFSAQWSSLSTSPLVSGNGYYNDQRTWQAFHNAVRRRLEFLGNFGAAMQAKDDALKRGQSHVNQAGLDAVQTTNIFVVHGHDEEMKQHLARTLTQLGLKPIILHEQANAGKTIIEKFEVNANVSFAVILLSPDDMAFPVGAQPKHAKQRSRQNVVLELGYFIGKLGRNRVFALKRGENLELPSDFSGVIYTPYDPAGHWRFELVKELKAAGFPVDANHLIVTT